MEDLAPPQLVNRLLRIEADYFVAGIVLRRAVHRVPPILHYMKLWPVQKILRYCATKGWYYTLEGGSSHDSVCQKN
jgi:hypothetical protein